MSKEAFKLFIDTVLSSTLGDVKNSLMLEANNANVLMYLEQFEEKYPKIIRSLHGYINFETILEEEEQDADLFKSSSVLLEYLVKHKENYDLKLNSLIKLCFKFPTESCMNETVISKNGDPSYFYISKAIMYLLEKGATVKESIFKKIFGNIDKWNKYNENYNSITHYILKIKVNIFYLLVKYDPSYINKIKEYYPFYNLVEAEDNKKFKNVEEDSNSFPENKFYIKSFKYLLETRLMIGLDEKYLVEDYNSNDVKGYYPFYDFD